MGHGWPREWRARSAPTDFPRERAAADRLGLWVRRLAAADGAGVSLLRLCRCSAVGGMGVVVAPERAIGLVVRGVHGVEHRLGVVRVGGGWVGAGSEASLSGRRGLLVRGAVGESLAGAEVASTVARRGGRAGQGGRLSG